MKPFWLNAQHSEVSKMLYYALLARLDLAQIRRKVTKNMLFSAKMTQKQAIFALKSKFFVTLRRLCAEYRRAKRA